MNNFGMDDWQYWEDDPEVRFRTFHINKDKSEGEFDGDYRKNEIGRVLSVSVPLNEEKTKFKCQFSYLSPKDLKCKETNRAYGKFLALARLNSDKAISFTKDHDESMTVFLKDFILQEADRKNIFWLKDKTVEFIG